MRLVSRDDIRLRDEESNWRHDDSTHDNTESQRRSIWHTRTATCTEAATFQRSMQKYDIRLNYVRKISDIYFPCSISVSNSISIQPSIVVFWSVFYTLHFHGTDSNVATGQLQTTSKYILQPTDVYCT